MQVNETTQKLNLLVLDADKFQPVQKAIRFFYKQNTYS